MNAEALSRSNLQDRDVFLCLLYYTCRQDLFRAFKYIRVFLAVDDDRLVLSQSLCGDRL